MPKPANMNFIPSRQRSFGHVLAATALQAAQAAAVAVVLIIIAAELAGAEMDAVNAPSYRDGHRRHYDECLAAHAARRPFDPEAAKRQTEAALNTATRRVVRARLHTMVQRFKRDQTALNKIYPARHPDLSIRSARDIKRVGAVEFALEAGVNHPRGGEHIGLNSRAVRIYGRLLQWDEQRTERLARMAA